ncbi:MAG: hypothetical protein HY510_00700, partial [Acidobacteria bacterium]|nr:hypothetical protein [Acidobacteriota bacterium]
GVFALLQGTAPNRRLTIEWAGVPIFPAVGNGTFEVTLFETSDQILFQYQDVVFGSAADNGGTAVAGVENATGNNGKTIACRTPAIPNGGANRFRLASSPTIIFRDDVEAGPGGWTPTGLWHRVMAPTCAPSSRSFSASWYYGQDATCNYDTGSTNAGDLTSPVIPALPQDAVLSFWHRRQTESDFNFDRSFVRARGGAGPFTSLSQVVMQGPWLHSEDTVGLVGSSESFWRIPGLTGQDLQIQFSFDTIDAAANDPLGWMIDDITIRACPVHGPSGAAAAAAVTAHPPAVCEGTAVQLDALGSGRLLGSYCTACSSLTYQWRENGAPIPGATMLTHVVPATQPAGTYAYSVDVGCTSGGGCSVTSDPVPVDVVVPPLGVRPTLRVDRAAGDLLFTWTDVAGADDYAVYSSPTPQGTFTSELGAAVSGGPGLTVPIPAGNIVCFLVAGRNPTCGTGPQN